MTLWGAPRTQVKEYGGWQCSRCPKRRMPRQRYCRDCHAAYERIRRQTMKELRMRLLAVIAAVTLAGCAAAPVPTASFNAYCGMVPVAQQDGVYVVKMHCKGIAE